MGYEYDLALSFAGEDREVARRLAHVAEANDLRVYFDEHYLWETWGQDLAERLGRIYGELSRYCVLLISEDYCRKPYTTIERRFALARALESTEEYVLPVRLDGSWPPGLPRTTAYFDLREVSVVEVAEAIVRKATGTNGKLRRPDDRVWPALERVREHARRGPEKTDGPGLGAIEFADVTIAAQCRGWKDGEPYVTEPWPEEPARWWFRGGMGWYEDPIFDITILNRSAASRLIRRLGIDVLGASYGAYGPLGGGGAEPVHLHRTYELPLPDVWAALAAGHIAAGRNVNDPRSCWGAWVDMDESAACRLPDPVLVDPGGAYRYGVHLLDYTSLCPTEVELRFWMETDDGRAISGPARLSYFIGGDIEPVQRYRRMLGGRAEVERQSEGALQSRFRHTPEERHERLADLAYTLWEAAGRPPGRDREFWAAAELELGKTVLAEQSLRTVHTRAL